MPPTSEPGRSVSSRLLQVLFAFRPGHTRLTLAGLARRTGMHQATVRRLAIELVAAGALDRAADGTLTVGTRLWQLGTLAPLTEPLRMVALPFMEDLYTALQQHVQLAVLEGCEAVIVERMSRPDAVGLVSGVGGGLPLHCSAVGKVLLAHGDAGLFDALVERGFDRFTTADDHRSAATAPRARRLPAHGDGDRARGADPGSGLGGDSDHGRRGPGRRRAVGRRPIRLGVADRGRPVGRHQRARDLPQAGVDPDRGCPRREHLSLIQ